MELKRFQALTQSYPSARIAILGDFCLDRYLEIDPARAEISLETGLPVHNVVAVRAQAGGAGTILNNLAALGVGAIFPVGFAGDDGDGFELRRALTQQKGVRLDGLIETGQRQTFTYCKPLVISKDGPPVELNRLDRKNWTPTPKAIEDEIMARLVKLSGRVDAFIILDQVDISDTGVVTRRVLRQMKTIAEKSPKLRILADSRRGLQEFPPVIFKMNGAELGKLSGAKATEHVKQIQEMALALARRNGQLVFVTLADRGIVGASPQGEVEHVAALPLRGEIDIVGAGDAVSANLTAALCAGANLRDAVEIANAAASVVIHKLGTTGTATVAELQERLFSG
jgi:rfaE bifunctional protein kinase chain/domain